MTPALDPLIHPLIAGYLAEDKARLFDLVRALGSPLHVLFPQIFLENAEQFQSVLRADAPPASLLYWAVKCNKSDCFLEAAALSGIRAEASSLHELRAALGHGIPGERISVSGPAKTDRYLLLALQHGCAIGVDSLYEIDALIRLAARPGLPPARLLLRVTGVRDRFSRFGIRFDDLPAAYDRLWPVRDRLRLDGFAFHIDGDSLIERKQAIDRVLGEMARARARGFQPALLDIGGGFRISYLPEAIWQRVQADDMAVPFLAGKWKRAYDPYHVPAPKAESLQALLADGVAEDLRREGLALVAEPGRALVDQAGITVMRVAGAKPASNGEWLVEVDANSYHLGEQWWDAEHYSDPIHLTEGEPGDPGEFTGGVAGNTCIERDIISAHTIRFARPPRAGDLLVYLNTAAYLMDQNESAFHRIPVPSRIAVFQNGGRWHWTRDGEFSQLDLEAVAGD